MKNCVIMTSYLRHSDVTDDGNNVFDGFQNFMLITSFLVSFIRMYPFQRFLIRVWGNFAPYLAQIDSKRTLVQIGTQF